MTMEPRKSLTGTSKEGRRGGEEGSLDLGFSVEVSPQRRGDADLSLTQTPSPRERDRGAHLTALRPEFSDAAGTARGGGLAVQESLEASPSNARTAADRGDLIRSVPSG